jgi:hypothetical protein
MGYVPFKQELDLAPGKRIDPMFSLINNTPFPAKANVLMDQHGDNLAVVAVKATFSLPSRRRPVEPAEEQLQPLSMEEYHDRPENSGIRYPADLVIGKAGTDVGLTGTVYSPTCEPVEKIRASVRVDTLQKDVQVYGDRYWVKSLFSPGHRKTAPEPFERMPLSCDRIFGGTDTDSRGNPVVYEPNPHGTGFVINKNHVGAVRLPNFEDPEHPVKSWRTKPQPAHFGFAPPAAPHRRAHAGTYDDAWKNTRFPLYPKDMDLRFFNCAQPELIAAGFLRGSETVTLENLSPDGPIRFRLPGYAVRMEFHTGRQSVVKKAELTTLMIEPDLRRFYMTWGVSASCGNNYTDLRVVTVDIMNKRETNRAETL